MKVSLNDLVEMLADRVGQPFNVPLQEQLKVILNYKRADWTQKVLDKHPEQRKFYYKDIVVELEKVDKAECPIQVDCDVLRTKVTIPTPVRTKDTLFDYVGDPDKHDAYGYATPDQLTWLVNYNKYTKDRPRYFYTNGYLYIYNDLSLEYVGIRGMWPDQRQLDPFKCTDGTPCYTDDDQYDIPSDIINIIIQDTLKNELRQLSEEKGEVTITTDDN